MLLQCPIDENLNEHVYQVAVNNVIRDEVEDIRVPIFSGDIPFVYVKRRSTATRFANENSSARLFETSDRLSNQEVAMFQRCATPRLARSAGAVARTEHQ